MEHIIIEEALIVSPTINSNQELILKLRVKREDYSMEIFEELVNLKDTWKPMSIVMKSFQPTENPVDDYIWRINSKRQKLAFLMEQYCENQWIDTNTEIEKIYTRYNVNSRANLTEPQLDTEIKFYEAWLNYNY